MFDLPDHKELDSVIQLLHRLKISIIIFGYEIGLSDDPKHEFVRKMNSKLTKSMAGNDTEVMFKGHN